MSYLTQDEKKARVIAFYLPQFHPVPANDKYWGKGFTEWTNVAKAKPLFRGHEQPRIPADLGFYDLRLPQVRHDQAELAKEAGIEGFCYWHYWFGNGKEVLEMPFNDVLKSGDPDFPFCVGWANHDWTTKTWEKGKSISKNTLIFKQEYPGEKDHIDHFYRLLPAFKDHRYIKVDGKLLFIIFEGRTFPNVKVFMKLWNDLAVVNGLEGFHFVTLAYSLPELGRKRVKISKLDSLVKETIDNYKKLGFDALNTINLKYAELKTGGYFHKVVGGIMRRLPNSPYVEKYDYSKIIDNYYTPADTLENVYPQLLAGWDRTPRSGKKAVVYYGTNPETFKKAARKVVNIVSEKKPEHRIIFLNSWNEWGEGAYMEPDLRYGKGMINALKEVLDE